jgi:hypothetical protein
MSFIDLTSWPKEDKEKAENESSGSGEGTDNGLNCQGTDALGPLDRVSVLFPPQRVKIITQHHLAPWLRMQEPNLTFTST